MKNKTYKAAIIGCGIISKHHIEAYEKVNRAQLVAVCDKDLKLAQRIAEKYSIHQVYGDYKELFDKENLDFVEILTPHSQRTEIIKQAIKNSVHINLQKVPATTIEEFENIVKTTSQNKIKLRVFENFRYYEPYQFAKDLIDKGTIGKIEIVNIKKYGAIKNAVTANKKQRIKAYAWRRTESENYKHPVLFDDGYHKHSLIEYFLGEPIDKVRAWSGYKKIFLRMSVDSPANVQYFTESNKLGTFQTINLNIRIENNFYPCDETIEILGSKGIIMVFGGHGKLFTDKHNSYIKQGVYWLDSKSRWHFSNEMDLDIRNSFTKGLEEFIELLEGRKTLLFNLNDAENSLRMGLAIVKSLRNNGELTLTRNDN